MLGDGMSDPFIGARIDRIERKADEAAPRYEVSALRSDVDRLEHTLRETRSEIDELRAQLSNAQSALIQLQEWITQSENP